MSQITQDIIGKFLLVAFLMLVVTPSLIILNISHNKIQDQNAIILEKLDALLVEQQPVIKGDILKDMTFEDKVVGDGEDAINNSKVKIEYTGKLIDGTVFDTSKGKKPLEFTLGAKMVVPGFEKGVLGMKVGGIRTVSIPPEMAYGKAGVPGVIPPNSTLIFEIELISVEDPKQDINNEVNEPTSIKALTPTSKDINNEELKNLLASNTILIDIRRPEEWKETGVIKGSHKLTLYDASGKETPGFLQKFQELVPTPQTPVILICRTGNRTSFAAKALTDGFGYVNVYNVKNGITDWIASGNEVMMD